MKMYIQAYSERAYLKKDFSEPHKIQIFNKSIKIFKNDPIPGFGYDYVDFESTYSTIYLDATNGIVNTRLEALKFNNPESKKTRTFHFLYCKLNWWQRQRMKLIEQQHWIQINDNNKWMVSILLAIVSFLFATYTFDLNKKIDNQNQEIKHLHDTIYGLKRSLMFLNPRSK